MRHFAAKTATYPTHKHRRSPLLLLLLACSFDAPALWAQTTPSHLQSSPRTQIPTLQETLILQAQKETTATTNPRVWLRLPEPVEFLKIDPFLGLRLAFVEIRTGLLKTLHIKTRQILTVHGPGIGKAFIWAPDGLRVIYRRQVKNPSGAVKGELFAFDHNLKRSILLEKINTLSGYPTLDPRDNQVLLLRGPELIQKKLRLPSSRLARWHMRRAERHGRFVATPRGILHVSPTARGMRALKDDGSGLQSFAVSAHGKKVVWATQKNGIYWAEDSWNRNDPTSHLVAYGLDPVWSHDHQHILFAGARTIGNHVAGYDVRLIDLEGQGQWLTQTFSSQERWPSFMGEERIIYTVENTTDLFGLNLKHAQISSSQKSSQTPSSL